jgi:hypothetical protein
VANVAFGTGMFDGVEIENLGYFDESANSVLTESCGPARLKRSSSHYYGHQ